MSGCVSKYDRQSSWRAKWGESFEKLQRDQDRPGSRYYNYPPVSSPGQQSDTFLSKDHFENKIDYAKK